MGLLKTLHESDFYAWCFEQANLIDGKKFNELDIENITEELQSLGRGEQKELKNFFILLFTHLLKWVYQSNRRCNSWKCTINNSRREIDILMKKNPSLKSSYDEIVSEAYDSAIYEASSQTNIDADYFVRENQIPMICVRKHNWFPE